MFYNILNLKLELPIYLKYRLVCKAIDAIWINLTTKNTFQNNNQYICDNLGNVICLDGWSRPDKLCRIPICEIWDDKKQQKLGCQHGSCIKPNLCACEVGWEGSRCEKCVSLSGCQEGSCLDQPFQCFCHNSSQWTGMLCDKREF